MEGRALDLSTVTQAVASLREIDPLPDLTNTPDTKRHLAGVLLQRMLPTGPVVGGSDISTDRAGIGVHSAGQQHRTVGASV
ncbi:MAG: hypothetical protein PSV40_09850 [Polaromonas sp.]|nr:hypothetical protein [Polaromonas sp.]MDI1269387.1 hypothetical protein [Polaromonas sp.]